MRTQRSWMMKAPEAPGPSMPEHSSPATGPEVTPSVDPTSGHRPVKKRSRFSVKYSHAQRKRVLVKRKEPKGFKYVGKMLEAMVDRRRSDPGDAGNTEATQIRQPHRRTNSGRESPPLGQAGGAFTLLNMTAGTVQHTWTVILVCRDYFQHLHLDCTIGRYGSPNLNSRLTLAAVAAQAARTATLE